MNQIPRQSATFYADDDRWCSFCKGQGFIKDTRADGTWINETCDSCLGTKLHGIRVNPRQRFASLEAGVQEYWDILNKLPNGWGQYIGPDGKSHETLLLLYKQFGVKPVHDALDKLIAKKDNTNG